jgi:hypothetical protein
VLNLTIPQIRMLEKNLYRICKAEAGGKEEEVQEDKNGVARESVGYTVRRLKEKTGRDNFTMQEVLNPDQTIKQHLKKQKV